MSTEWWCGSIGYDVLLLAVLVIVKKLPLSEIVFEVYNGDVRGHLVIKMCMFVCTTRG